MDNDSRVRRAAEIGRRQRLQSSQRLSQAQPALPPLSDHLVPDPTLLDYWAGRIQVSVSKFWLAPFSLRKTWFYLCGLVWSFFVISLIRKDPFGGSLISLFSLLPLWFVVNLPGWIGFGLSSGTIKNNRGKSV